MTIRSWLYQYLYPTAWQSQTPGKATGVGADTRHPIPTGPIRFNLDTFPGTAYGLTVNTGKASETLDYMKFTSGRSDVTWKMSHYAAYLATEMKKPHSGFLVIRNAQNRIVGTAAVLNKGLDAHIVMVSVAANQRRRGLARWMMQTLMDHAKERGFENVTLDVRNPNAIELYKTLGFTATGQTTQIGRKRYLCMKRPCNAISETLNTAQVS